ncbi:MAG: phenylalanine--tRNA ligase subunit beta [Lachnospiraceae bacterium]|nr:phenylalanine--tRNA ligase subunit beta [Lachnospiraceae bacterium]
MDTSLNWIKAYVPGLECTDEEYFDRMTLTGTKVEGFKRPDKNLEKIVVGKILSIERHPDADKLIVCRVSVGNEELQIVTGAPNVNVGDLIPVVLDGGKVAGGHDGGPLPEDGIKIKSGKLRGVDSFGMMCAIEELGSDRNLYPEAPENGVYIFPEGSAEPGDDAIELLGLHDTIFEYEITSNRVDCYSVLGIAREAAATFDRPFVPPVVKETGNDEDVNSFVKVEIKDTDLCSRYCARAVKNIRIGESPAWLRHRLASAGVRPINNIVDITNYVMLEYGQPMHAYDMDKLAGSRIVVKRAEDGESFVTLDGAERKLDKDVLMICDGEKEVGIAGIMGGENSMITDDVKNMLFEAATFNGANIRKSAKRLGLRTDASGIFEKGLDPANAEAAINRACALIEELDAGDVVGGMVDAGLPIKEETKIEFKPDKYNKLLGTDISAEDMLAIFKKLEIAYDDKSGMLVIPSFRQDLKGQADIAEEVARFFGYDKIPLTLPSGEGMEGKLSYPMRIEAIARDSAERCGFSQAYEYSFESPRVFDKLLIPEGDALRAAITISNPLGEDFSIMRTTSVNGMLTALSLNFSRRNKDVKLYELGNIYVPHALPLTELPDERMQFTLGFYGKGDFYSMKGAVEVFLKASGMKDEPEYDASADAPFLHPGRKASVIYKGEKIGFLGEVHPLVAKNYGIKDRVYLAVLDMPVIVPLTSFDMKYEGIAKFPAVTRDISMVAKKETTAGSIEKMIRQRGGKILESVKLFDIYEGDQVKAGYKSIAYSLSFRDMEKTLSDEEVGTAMKKILNGLQSMDIELRS